MKSSLIRRARELRADARLKYLIVLLAISAAAMAQTGAKMELPAAKPEEVGLSAERLQRINDVIQRHVDAKHISGAVTVVARKGRVAHFEARGLMDVESKKPMPKDAIFVLASMTKPVTGVAVMMLVEEGKFQLTDPVSKFLPEFNGMKVATQTESGSEIQLIPAGNARSRSGIC